MTQSTGRGAFPRDCLTPTLPTVTSPSVLTSGVGKRQAESC